ncbi:hypothetical protein ASD15_30365 [Massilia sp. Root351]|nr:hypothetical protein ASD15_30365 [Massilia sp. Root351]
MLQNCLLEKKSAALLSSCGFFGCRSSFRTFAFFRCQSSQTTCKARYRSQHNAQQLRDEDFTARNARQRGNSSFIQLFTCVVTGDDDQLVVGFSEVVDDFRCCNGIIRDRVDQRTGHAVSQGGELRTFYCTASQGVLQNTQVYALGTRFSTKLRQVSNLDATVLGHDHGLRSCYFCGNFGYDGLFVIQIETHGQPP